MGMLYTAVMDAVSVSAAADLFWIGAPADSIVIIHEIRVTQAAQETSEQLNLKIFRTTTDQSAVGTSITPNPLEVGFAAAGSTVRSNITGGSLSTISTLLWEDSQNLINGWHYLPTPEIRIILSPTAGTAGRLAVRLATAPAAAITVTATITFEEIGG